MYPDAPFAFEFLDASIAALCKKELAASWLVQIATAMTIFISCLGLVGLTLFSAEKRAKEIGIRKVLGAGVLRIVAMLIGELLLLVAIAFVIAVPLSAWYMNGWLQDFAYKVNVGWTVFAATGLMAFIILIGTVGWQSLKAARQNPINNLRTE